MGGIQRAGLTEPRHIHVQSAASGRAPTGHGARGRLQCRRRQPLLSPVAPLLLVVAHDPRKSSANPQTKTPFPQLTAPRSLRSANPNLRDPRSLPPIRDLGNGFSVKAKLQLRETEPIPWKFDTATVVRAALAFRKMRWGLSEESGEELAERTQQFCNWAFD